MLATQTACQQNLPTLWIESVLRKVYLPGKIEHELYSLVSILYAKRLLSSASEQ